jgi:hypothetical protein
MTAAEDRVPANLRSEMMSRLFRDLQIYRYNELCNAEMAKRAAFWIRCSTYATLIVSSAAFVFLWKDVGDGLIAQILVAIAALITFSVIAFDLQSKLVRWEGLSLHYGVARERALALLRDLKVSELESVHLGREVELQSFVAAVSALGEVFPSSLAVKCWDRTEVEYDSDKAWTSIV